MATVNDSITRIRRVLVDESDTNYQDNELYQYFNDAIAYISGELARRQSRLVVTNTTLSYAEHAYSASLPSDFLALATNEEGDFRVFNVSNDYAQMNQAQVSDMDDWENEDNDDDGTPTHFIINGANMIIHPRADAATTVKIYYHPLESITDDSSTMPFSSWFDKPIEAFVIRQSRLRSEMFNYAGADMGDYERLWQQCSDILALRETNLITMRPTAASGWSK